MNRREFLQRLTATTAGLAGLRLPPPPKPPAAGPARVVVAQGLGGAAQARPEAVRSALTDSVCRLVGDPAGWRRLFGPEDVVGLKVNCVCAARPTQRVVVEAIVEGLRSAGVRDNHILIFDRKDEELQEHGGFEINRSRRGVRCLGCKDGLTPQAEFQACVVDDTVFEVSHLVTEVCTALINVPVLKDHSMAGVTLSLKNHYGSLKNALNHHGMFLHCDPQIAQLNSLPAIREKTRLIVCDALTGMFDGGPFGPGQQWDCGKLIVATDPVAADTVGWQLLNQQRHRVQLPPIPCPAHLRTAGPEGYALGENRLERIEVLV